MSAYDDYDDYDNYKDNYRTSDGRSIDQTIGCKSNIGKVRLVPILEDIDWPTVIKSYPNTDQLLVATLTGYLWLVDIRCRRRRLWLDISDRIGTLGIDNNIPYDERGLIGLELHPDFTENGLLYLYYSQIRRNSTSPSVLSVDPCVPSTQRQVWDNYGLYSHINVLEEWRYTGHVVKYVRPLLRIKQPFHNNNGMNNLTWDKTRGSLILITGDGGYVNDPFNLALDPSSPHGKVLSLVPSSISYPTYVDSIARLDQLPITVRRAIGVISSGIRNSHGLLIYNSVTVGEGVEYFLTHNGQSSNEALYRYDPNNNTQPTVRKSITSLGWSGWDNGQPNTLTINCSGKHDKSKPLIISKSIDVIRPTVRTVSWNVTSRCKSTIKICNGDTLRFLSTDGNYHDIYQVEPMNGSWKSVRKIHGDQCNIDYLYRPVVNNVETTLYYLSSRYPVRVITVNVEPVRTIDTYLTKATSEIQNGATILSSSSKVESTVQVVVYPDRLSHNKLLPYFSYPHSSHIDGHNLSYLSKGDNTSFKSSSHVDHTVGHDEYRENRMRGEVVQRSIYSGRFSSAPNRLEEVTNGDDYRSPSGDSIGSSVGNTSKYASLSFDERDDEYEPSVLGSRITGVAMYGRDNDGDNYGRGRGGSTFGRGLVVSEWNRKIHNLLPSNKGHLFWVTLDPLSRLRYQDIQVVNYNSRPTYYVSLNSHNGRLYLGIYHSPFAGQLKMGAIVELVPI